jgi:hypothetical protein
MKTIIQLAIVALMLNAGYQAVRSYYTFYDFQARLTEEVQRPRIAKSSELHKRAVELGTEFGIDLEYDAIEIRNEAGKTFVEFSYVDDVAFVPKYYIRPWEWRGTASAVRQRPLEIDERY